MKHLSYHLDKKSHVIAHRTVQYNYVSLRIEIELHFEEDLQTLYSTWWDSTSVILLICPLEMGILLQPSGILVSVWAPPEEERVNFLETTILI